MRIRQQKHAEKVKMKAMPGFYALCRLFCEVDDVTCGGLRKLGFSRTKTLGCGADCCDFRFCRK